MSVFSDILCEEHDVFVRRLHEAIKSDKTVFNNLVKQ